MCNLLTFDNKYVCVFVFYYFTMGTKSFKSKNFWSKLNCVDLPVLCSYWIYVEVKGAFSHITSIPINFLFGGNIRVNMFAYLSSKFLL